MQTDQRIKQLLKQQDMPLSDVKTVLEGASFFFCVLLFKRSFFLLLLFFRSSHLTAVVVFFLSYLFSLFVLFRLRRAEYASTIGDADRADETETERARARQLVDNVAAAL